MNKNKMSGHWKVYVMEFASLVFFVRVTSSSWWYAFVDSIILFQPRACTMFGWFKPKVRFPVADPAVGCEVWWIGWWAECGIMWCDAPPKPEPARWWGMWWCGWCGIPPSECIVGPKEPGEYAAPPSAFLSRNLKFPWNWGSWQNDDFFSLVDIFRLRVWIPSFFIVNGRLTWNNIRELM